MLIDKDKKLYGDVGVAVTPAIAIVGKDGKLLKEQPYVPLLAGILEVEVKVALGKMTREEADLSLKPEETPQVSAEEKEADKVYNLGLVLLERGMRDKAIEKFKQVLTIDPTYCKVRLQLGHLYLQDNKTDDAKAEFEYVLKCDPQSHEAKVGMGTVYGNQGDYDKAIELLESSLLLNPKVELAHYELGKVYEKKGQLDKAVENYKKALDRLLSR
jgi:tetratricopeptide (TPR) repeat protein